MKGKRGPRDTWGKMREFLGEERALVAAWPETQNPVQRELCTNSCEPANPTQVAFRPGRSLLALRTAWGGAGRGCVWGALLQGRSGTRAPLPLSVVVRIRQREAREPRVGHAWGSDRSALETAPSLTSLRDTLPTAKGARFTCTTSAC